jgi:hypothetical protein
LFCLAGCFDAVCDLLASLGIAITIQDCRTSGAPIPFAFTGALRPSQEPAIAALLPHDTGLLAATTAFGKTVLAIRMMAERGFLDEYISALALFGGGLLSVLYDNLKIAVARSVAGKQERTRAFTELVSHYLFNERFGRPGKGPERLPV